MDRRSDRRLIRFLHGELAAGEVRALQAELARDPALRGRLERLQGLWQGLEAPPPTPAPYGFTARVVRGAAERRARAQASAFGWALTPPWLRAVAAAALLGGVALGIDLGRPLVGASPAAAPLATAAPVATVAQAAPAASPVGPGAAPAAATASASPEPDSGAILATGASGGSGAAAPAPLTGEATFAEEYMQALAGGDATGAGRHEGAG